MNIRLRVVLTLVLLFLLEVPWIIDFAGAGLRRAYPAPGRLVSTGARRLHLYCTGTGSPAIVLESGLGTDWVTWRLVIPQLARTARVCMYDRAGYGWSDPGPEPRTVLRLADELHSLLHNAGMRPPVVMVAHSFGAHITRVFAARFPGSLSGVVLVDPSDEEEPSLRPSLGRTIHNLLPPSGLAGLLRLCEGERGIPAELRNLSPVFRNRFMVGASHNEALAERSEREALPESENQVRACTFPAEIPLTVLTAEYIVAPGHSDASELAAVPGHIGLQARLARMSSRGKQVVAADSGHTIQLDRPDLVVRAVQEMIQGY